MTPVILEDSCGFFRIPFPRTSLRALGRWRSLGYTEASTVTGTCGRPPARVLSSSVAIRVAIWAAEGFMASSISISSSSNSKQQQQ